MDWLYLCVLAIGAAFTGLLLWVCSPATGSANVTAEQGGPVSGEQTSNGKVGAA